MVTITSFSFQETNTALVLATTHTRAPIALAVSSALSRTHTFYKPTTYFLEAVASLSHLHFDFVAIMQVQNEVSRLFQFSETRVAFKIGQSKKKKRKKRKTPTGILAR